MAKSLSSQRLKSRILYRHSPLTVVRVLFVFLLLALSLTVMSSPKAQAAVSPYVNFQARLMNNGGGIVPDGTYNIEFKLYNAASSSGSSQGSCTGDANCLWTETRTSGNVVTVKNGYVTVNLGSVTSLPSIDWSQQLWLTMRIGGIGAPSWDPEMSPRLQMTATPYAFSAGKLSTTNGSFTSTLSIGAPTGGSQIFTIPDQGAAGSYNLLTTASAATGFIQNGTSPQTANYNITGNGTIGGNLLVSGTYNGNTFTGDTLTFSNAAQSTINAAAGQNLALSAPATQSILIGTVNSNTITLGTTTATSTITLGRSTTSNTINIGNGNTSNTNTQTINIGAGTPAGTGNAQVTIGNTANNSAVTANAGTGNINLNTVNTTGGTIVKSATSNSTAALQIQNASNNEVLTVDTANGRTILGKASSITGKLLLYNGTNANTVTLQSGTTSTGYTLTLPTAVGASGDCLKDSTGAGVLAFGSCGTNGVTTIGAIDTQTKSVNGAVISGTSIYMQTADASNPGLVSTGPQTIAGNKTLTGATTLTLATNSAVALTVNATSGTTAVGAIVNQGQTADVLQLNSTASAGTQTNGMLYTHNGTGTTTNALNITNTTGTLTNGLNFSGTIGTDINRGSGTLTMNGGSGVNLQVGGSTAVAVDANGATVNGTLALHNSYPVYSWTTPGGSDLNYKTIANVNLGTGTNVGATFTVDLSAACTTGSCTGFSLHYVGSIMRSGAVQDDTLSATVRGPYASYVRVVKTSNSTYELQVSQAVTGNMVTFTTQFTSVSGGTVTYVQNPANGSAGTNYTSSVTNTSYFSHIHTEGNILITNTNAIALSVSDNFSNPTLNVDTTTRTVYVDNIDAFATTGSPAPIARISRVSASSGANFGTGAYSPATTFTPNAGTVLIANVVMEKDTFGTNMNTTGSDITFSGGGLTWVPIVGRAATIGNTYDMAFRSFYAVVGGSPASTTVTTRSNGNGTAFPSFRYHVMVDEYSGVDTTTPVAGAISGNRFSTNNDTFTATLGATPTTGDVKIGVSGMDEDNSPYGYLTPSGWSQIYNRNPSGGEGPDSQILSRTNSTSTTLNWSLTGNLDLSPNTMTVYGGYILKQSTTTTTNAVLTLGAASTDIVSSASRSFQVQNGVGSSLMYIDSASGRVGIGTNGPAYKLDVQDSQANNYVMRIQNGDTGTNADGLLIDLGIPGSRNNNNQYIAFSNGGSNISGVIRGNGSGVVQYLTTGADYAEYFKAPPGDLPDKAELVQLNPNDKQAVLRSDSDTQKPIAGIVSTAPGFVGNGPICLIHDDDCDANYEKSNALISMTGQVPLKVDNSHGLISVGDPVTVSATPGVGAKATTSGYIVGSALESLDGASGTIMILVRPQYYTPPVANFEDQVTSLQNQVAGFGSTINTGMMQALTLKVTGNANIQGDLNVGGTIKAKNLELSGHFITHGQTPVVELLPAAGIAGAGADPQVSVVGNDISGLITIVTGTDASADAILRLTFNKPYGSTPQILLTPVGKGSASLQPYVDSPTNTNMAIGVIQVPQSGETYKFNYQIMQ